MTGDRTEFCDGIATHHLLPFPKQEVTTKLRSSVQDSYSPSSAAAGSPVMAAEHQSPDHSESVRQSPQHKGLFLPEVTAAESKVEDLAWPLQSAILERKQTSHKAQDGVPAACTIPSQRQKKEVRFCGTVDSSPPSPSDGDHIWREDRTPGTTPETKRVGFHVDGSDDDSQRSLPSVCDPHSSYLKRNTASPRASRDEVVTNERANIRQVHLVCSAPETDMAHAKRGNTHTGARNAAVPNVPVQEGETRLPPADHATTSEFNVDDSSPIRVSDPVQSRSDLRAAHGPLMGEEFKLTVQPSRQTPGHMNMVHASNEPSESASYRLWADSAQSVQDQVSMASRPHNASAEPIQAPGRRFNHQSTIYTADVPQQQAFGSPGCDPASVNQPPDSTYRQSFQPDSWQKQGTSDEFLL